MKLVCLLLLITWTLVSGRKIEVDFDIDSVLCENRLIGFFVTDNADVSAVPSKEVSNVTEEECRQICADNRDLDGRSVLCASFSYDHIIFKCAIYKKRSDPDGELERMDAPGKRYFEKFCLDEKVPKKCANQHFQRIDDSVLVGYANSTSFFPTLSECANECLRQGSQCRSAMYFYNEGECITNLESASTKPEDFRAPDKEDGKVVYFNNGCYQEEEKPNVQEIKQESEKKKTGISKEKTTKKVNTNPIKQKVDNEVEKSVEIPTTEAPVMESENKTSVEEQEKSESEVKIEVEEPNHPKDVVNRLYGAKQLTKSTDGTIVEQAPSNSTSSEIIPIKTEEESDKNDEHEAEKEISQEEQEPVTELPVLPKSNEIKSTVLKSGPKKNLKIQKVQPAVEKHEDNGLFSEWGDWTPCTQPGERRIRRRKCLDLKKCRGALMQVDWCPKILSSTPESEELINEPVGPLQTPIPVAKSSAEGSPPSILPPQLPKRELQPLPEGAPGSPDDVWSPWLGVCRHFASTQPCKNNEVIGFESRECIAKDPKACNGPFFRYCTLPC